VGGKVKNKTRNEGGGRYRDAKEKSNVRVGEKKCARKKGKMRVGRNVPGGENESGAKKGADKKYEKNQRKIGRVPLATKG